jgi:uncharacterized protein
MTMPQGMTLSVPHYLLALAIVMAWAPPITLPFLSRTRSWPLWPVAFGGALLTGLMQGVLGPIPTALCVVMAGMLWLGSEVDSTGQRLSATSMRPPYLRRSGLVLGVVLALAFALHKVPGFARGFVIPEQRITLNAALYSQYLNFDKGAAGLLLLALVCRRARNTSEWAESFLVAVVVTWFTLAVAVPIALAYDYVNFSPKLPTFTATFLFVNLFFTCVAEEAFFRGVVQEKLHQWCERSAWCSRGIQQRWVPIAVVLLMALPFGVAHTPSSVASFLFIFVASVSYGIAYLKTRRIETSILVHFFVNTTHFLLFTYPYRSV